MCTGTHPFIPAANTAVVRMIFQTAGGLAMNVLHFTKPDGWDASSLLDLCDAVDSNYETTVKTFVSSDVLLKEVQAQDVSVEDGPFNSLVVLAAGGLNERVLPDNVTLAVSFRSGFTGRSRRGRLFHVGLTESQVTGDRLAASVQANLTTVYNEWFNSIVADMPTVEHVIVSYCHNGAWRTDALVTPVTALSIDDTTDSMRKRLLGRGR